MNKQWLSYLCCPKCMFELVDDGNEQLCCQKCDNTYPVINGVPRFVNTEQYADGFGFQWNLFKKTQHDSYSGIEHSKTRFFNETGWKKDELEGDVILDAGCGNGRFSEVAIEAGVRVIALDLSDAVDACRENMLEKGFDDTQFLVIQASFYEMPIKKNILDKAYSLGVLQHTPDRKKSLQHIVNTVKNNGEVAFWVYEKSWRSLIGYKYYFRILTKYLSMQSNWKISQALVYAFFPLAWVLNKVKGGALLIRAFIPFAFRFNESMSYEQSRQWSLLDTFDNLSPRYDNPVTRSEIEGWLKSENVGDIEFLNTPGLAVRGVKQ